MTPRKLWPTTLQLIYENFSEDFLHFNYSKVESQLSLFEDVKSRQGSHWSCLHVGHRWLPPWEYTVLYMIRIQYQFPRSPFVLVKIRYLNIFDFYYISLFHSNSSSIFPLTILFFKSLCYQLSELLKVREMVTFQRHE